MFNSDHRLASYDVCSYKTSSTFFPQYRTISVLTRAPCEKEVDRGRRRRRRRRRRRWMSDDDDHDGGPDFKLCLEHFVMQGGTACRNMLGRVSDNSILRCTPEVCVVLENSFQREVPWRENLSGSSGVCWSLCWEMHRLFSVIHPFFCRCATCVCSMRTTSGEHTAKFT